MARPKGENTIRKHFKLTEETAKFLAERSKAENMNDMVPAPESVGTSKKP